MASECGSALTQEFDQKMHIAGVFILMGCSFCGTMLPILGKKYTSFKYSDLMFSCAKLFGSGIILATALVHMLSPASENLSNECLPPVFSEDGYPAFAPAICLGGILFVHFIQFCISKEMRKLHDHLSHANDTEMKSPTPDLEKNATSAGQEHHHPHHHHDGHDHAYGLILKKERQIGAYVLELGVASHSVIIGIALGVAREEFKTLLAALVFHQFFEGMALSTVVMESDFKKRAASIVMVAFYTLTTPIGMAVGIGISSSFNENSVSNLVTQGVLDALSAGILLYDGLVNVVTPHFKTETFMKQPTWQQLIQLACLWLGAVVMALIGKWA
mmetsp:Transcript_1481/g.1961  ORF Transcript_1481/g.1961 Transcript_1481/m.1961 type:complete len:331 (+) Transcript_1481:25-1017(+)